jgi:hypothetical protein
MSAGRLLPLLAAILLLSGCAFLQGLPVFAPAPQVEDERLHDNDETRCVIRLLEDFGRLTALPDEEQTRAYQAAQREFEQEPGAPQRLRLALLMTLPQASLRDDARALQLLEVITASVSTEPSTLKNLALVIQKFILERRRLARDVQHKAEDTQQKLQNQLAERQRQLHDEQRKVEDLEKKVEALRAIDRDTLNKATRR